MKKHKYLITFQYPTKKGMQMVTQEIFCKRKIEYCMRDILEMFNEKHNQYVNITLIKYLGIRCIK